MGDPKQVNQQPSGSDAHHFDAIVIGSGISGGWAAKELCEKGLKTLVLERGRNVEHIKDYKTAMMSPWHFEHRLKPTHQQIAEDPLKYAVSDEATSQFYASDKEHPYIQETPFNWIRGYQVGGRSLTWGRQCYRYNEIDFEANLKDGHGVDWPIRYSDLAPWYDYVEKYIGVSGKSEGCPALPDGDYLPAMEMNCVEEHFAGKVKSAFNGRTVTIGRVANLTRGWNGRGPCQFRNLCSRGCPFTGYFSSNAATLPSAASTGNLTLKADSIVTEIIYDSTTQKAKGVRVIDAVTNQATEYFARIIFVNASAIASAAILLNSVSASFPTGLGNSSGQLGHNLMDHFHGTGATATFDGFKDKYFSGRRPVGIYIPRYRNISAETTRKDYVRGFGLQGSGTRDGWKEQGESISGFGKKFKEQVTQPGPWTLWLGGWGETLPYYENKVSLSKDQKDKWGVPLVQLFYQVHENEENMRKDMQQSIEEMLSVAGFNNINSYSHQSPGGSAIHEMGTVRMGRDPKTSVLNGYNQMHDVKNVFVTDGACMTSSGTANPSLTYMALTARACNYAVEELKKGNL
jgi:choline dehydrogenase-like flavoprotein